VEVARPRRAERALGAPARLLVLLLHAAGPLEDNNCAVLWRMARVGVRACVHAWSLVTCRRRSMGCPACSPAWCPGWLAARLSTAAFPFPLAAALAAFGPVGPSTGSVRYTGFLRLLRKPHLALCLSVHPSSARPTAFAPGEYRDGQRRKRAIQFASVREKEILSSQESGSKIRRRDALFMSREHGGGPCLQLQEKGSSTPYWPTGDLCRVASQ
jgi:hypothetical protein